MRDKVEIKEALDLITWFSSGDLAALYPPNGATTGAIAALEWVLDAMDNESPICEQFAKIRRLKRMRDGIHGERTNSARS